MADTKINFNADIEVPNLVVTENLAVKGTSTIENVENVLVKGAVTVINSDNTELNATLMGTVIRTGKTDDNDYAMLYNPSEEEIQLGVGLYDEDSNTFTFNEGEGLPITVRELGEEDINNPLVAWDTKKLCLTNSNIKAEDVGKIINLPIYTPDTMPDEAELPRAYLSINEDSGEIFAFTLDERSRFGLTKSGSLFSKGDIFTKSKYRIDHYDDNGNLKQISLGIDDFAKLKDLITVTSLYRFSETDAKNVNSIIGNDLDNNVAGCKGYYWNYIQYIDDNSFKVYLTDVQPINVTEVTYGIEEFEPNTSIEAEYSVGDIISLVNDSKYERAGTVSAIDPGIITVSGACPFDEIEDPELPFNIDDFSIYCADKPEVGNHIIHDHATVFGKMNKATGLAAFSAGQECNAYGNHSIALGRNCEAGYSAFAAGRYAKAIGYSSVSLGQFQTSFVKYSITMGMENRTHGTYSSAIGYGNSTGKNGKFSSAFGYLTSIGNDSALAFGKSTNSYFMHKVDNHFTERDDFATRESKKTDYATLKQYHDAAPFTLASGIGSIAGGLNCVAIGAQSVAIGNSSFAKGKQSIALGYKTYAGGEDSFSVGSGTDNDDVTLPGGHILEKGAFSAANGKYSVAIGARHSVNGSFAGAFGAYNYIYGGGSFALGRENYLHSNLSAMTSTACSFALGYQNYVEGMISYALGYGLSSKKHQVVLGEYNEVDNDKALILGRGSSDTDRKNIFTVDGSGNGYFAESIGCANKIVIGNTEVTEEQLAQLLQILKNNPALIDHTAITVDNTNDTLVVMN